MYNWASCEHNEHIWIQKTSLLKHSWPNFSLFAQNILNTHYAIIFPFYRVDKAGAHTVLLHLSELCHDLFTLFTFSVHQPDRHMWAGPQGATFLKKQLCVSCLSWLAKNSQVPVHRPPQARP